MYYKHLSNGAMYDPRRGLYIHFLPDLPHPQNRKQINLTRLRVQNIRSLTEEEIDYLFSEVTRLNRLPIKSCKEDRWYKDRISENIKEYRMHSLKHEYYWTKYNLQYFDNGRMSFGQWMKKFKPKEYHSFYGLQYLPKQQRDKWLAVRTQAQQRKWKEAYDWFQ